MTKETLHVFSEGYFGASMVSSLLVQVLPRPAEVNWKPYTIAFNTLQRLSVHRRAFGNGHNEVPPVRGDHQEK